LVVKNERQKYNFVVYLRQSWYDSPCTPGCYINIIGDCNFEHSYIIDDQNGLLILHPDQLLSATSVSESSECLRRSVLSDRVKMATNKNSALVYGYLLHELFQEAMKTNQWDERWLDKCAREILPLHLEDLLEIGVSVEQARDHLRSKAPVLQAWAEVFVQANPGVSTLYLIPHDMLMLINLISTAKCCRRWSKWPEGEAEHQQIARCGRKHPLASVRTQGKDRRHRAGVHEG
jgi:DNA replication ATP-dependent helicase Dna2